MAATSAAMTEEKGTSAGAENGPVMALRLGLRQVKGLAQADAEAIVAARGAGYGSIAELWRRARTGRQLFGSSRDHRERYLAAKGA